MFILHSHTRAFREVQRKAARRDAIPLALFFKKKYLVTSLLDCDATGIRFKVFLGCFSSIMFLS